MSFLKSTLDFLLGKDADIFDENGKVVHKLPKKRWDLWQNRIKAEAQYNWRNHTGTQAGKKATADKNSANNNL